MPDTTPPFEPPSEPPGGTPPDGGDAPGAAASGVEGDQPARPLSDDPVAPGGGEPGPPGAAEPGPARSDAPGEPDPDAGTAPAGTAGAGWDDVVWSASSSPAAPDQAALPLDLPPAGAARGPVAGGAPAAVSAPPPPPSRRGTGFVVLVALVAAILGATLAAGAVWWLLDGGTGDAAPGTVTVVERVEIVSPDTGVTVAAAVARRVLPSIVTVEIADTATGNFATSGSGSGVVLSGDGLLVTNDHVVEGAARIRVVFADGRIFPADLVGTDPLTDLAVIRIAAAGLTPVEIGSSEALAIGDPAIAVGSPLGLEGGPSVTVGVVSAFERRVRTGMNSELFGMIQTDAPITRGSSGGALVDAEGRLIGITTAIGVSDVGAEGLGFAIPVELMTRITDDLISSGIASHAFLGIQGATFFEERPDGSTVPAGVLVDSVIDDTAAAAAGIEAGDIIRSFAGRPIATMEQLVVRLRFYRVGDVVDVAITRAGEDLTIRLTLMERPEDV